MVSQASPESAPSLITDKALDLLEKKKCVQSKSAPPVSVLTAEINCALSERFLATLSNDPNCRLLPPRLGRAPGLGLTVGGWDTINAATALAASGGGRGHCCSPRAVAANVVRYTLARRRTKPIKANVIIVLKKSSCRVLAFVFQS